MKWLFAGLAALCISVNVGAQEAVAPDVLVRNVTTEVLEIVRKDRDIQSGSHRKAIDLVEAKVLPHFNFARMAQLATARDWRQASPAQQKALTPPKEGTRVQYPPTPGKVCRKFLAISSNEYGQKSRLSAWVTTTPLGDKRRRQSP